MELTSAALWLNESFGGFDSALLGFYHSMADAVGVVFTPLFKLITLLGEKGLVFFLLALLFMLFARSRDLGVCIFGAVCCGALITNIILKDSICRPRPFEMGGDFMLWWQFVGSPAEDGYSFPSGHVTAAAAGMTAICMMRGKKWIAPSAIVVTLMAVSRNYLMAHYPSDVLAAALVGIVSGVIAWAITKLIFKLLERWYDIPFFELVLDIDLGEFLPVQGLPLLGRLSGGRETEEDYEDYEDFERPARQSRPAPRRERPGAYVGKHEKR